SVEGTDEYRLPNGLQVLLVADDSKPTTTVNLTYRVGSRFENYGETGMAHLLEHMLFKGTPRHEKVWAEFQKRGLAANGSTWFDRTNYTARFSANDDNLHWYLGWLADSMVNSYVARKDLDTEMTVVRNEMESGENNPSRILSQRTMAVMFDWHNYGHATIGARADVENVDIPRLQAFYRLYYQPDNATLIVSGKFDPARVLEWVGGTFGAIPKPTRTLPVLYTLDPVQDGERSVTLRRVGGAPLVQAGYHVPAGASRDDAAVELLTLILGDTPSGRLYKRLTQTQLAASVYSYSFALADPGAMFVGAQLAPGQDVDKARNALLATTESIRSEPITAEELARAKVKWLKDWDQSFTNPETVGIALSESVAQGDWRLFFLTRDRVRDIALADVQRVAEQYLLPDNRTLGTYLPTDKPQRAPAPVRVDLAQEMNGFKPQAAAAKVEAFEATPANIDARTQTFTVGGVKAAVLPKGTRGNAVTAVLTLHFGDEHSLFGQNQAAQAVATLLDKGTKTLTREQVQDRLDALQTELSVSSSPGRVTVSLVSRREHLPAAIELVGDLLRNPVFPAEALDEMKRGALSAIEQQRKDPGALARNALDRLGNPYPRGDVRYRPTFDELAADYRALDVAQLRAFHARFYGARDGEFSAVGDLDAAKVRAALQTALGDWSAGAPFTRVPQPLIPVKPEQLMLTTPDKPNATMLVRLGVPLADTDADYPALMLANHLLGAGGNSRLWKRIREKDGLSYDVRSTIDWDSLERNSRWQASAIFAPQNRARVEADFREEVARALKDGFSEQELREGQASLLNYRKLARAQDGGVAFALANNLYLGRTYALQAQVDAEIGKLTLEQVNAALRKYVTPDMFVSVFAGDFKP
ncbi:MAG: insulinase family protein, partial [Burkholderiales bacterium]|nr:insulinase family protein [Burkholderiales bacterium]